MRNLVVSDIYLIDFWQSILVFDEKQGVLRELSIFNCTKDRFLKVKFNAYKNTYHFFLPLRQPFSVIWRLYNRSDKNATRI